MTQGEGARDERRVSKMARQARRCRRGREIPLCAGRPFHRSERGRESRPAPFGMKINRMGRVHVGAEAPTPMRNLWLAAAIKKKENRRRARYIVPLQEPNPGAAPIPPRRARERKADPSLCPPAAGRLGMTQGEGARLMSELLRLRSGQVPLRPQRIPFGRRPCFSWKEQHERRRYK
jgi:hypothetical protein